ncbi:MAG: hypothetical protein JWR72_314 [Flavisolibacter sp.]|jgi:hypothetical protein|nr:hypothetical protein [Flavisolibacter sp.]
MEKQGLRFASSHFCVKLHIEKIPSTPEILIPKLLRYHQPINSPIHNPYSKSTKSGV